jgi:hypothetical protein
MFTRNPNLTWEAIKAAPDAAWNWPIVCYHPMTKHEDLLRRQRVEEKRRALARCAAIKEELMAAAWAPARVERWLEAGGIDAF